MSGLKTPPWLEGEGGRDGNDVQSNMGGMAVVDEVQGECQLRNGKNTKRLIERGQLADHSTLLDEGRGQENSEHGLLKLHLPGCLAHHSRREITERWARCVPATAVLQQRRGYGWVPLCCLRK